MQESASDPDNYFHRIVIGDGISTYYYDLLSEQEAKVWQKTGEGTTTRFRRTKPPEKIIFWNKSGILLSKYLPSGTTISGSYYASIIEWLYYTIVEKHGGKVVLLLHDNVPVDKSNVVQATIRKGDFVELNHSVYSPDIAPSDCQI